MRIFKKLSLAVAVLAALFALTPSLALADSGTKNAIQCGVNSAASGDCTNAPTKDLNVTVRSIINILSIIVGVAAVIMIIVAGLRFITSAGNPEGAKSARNTILYAVIGLVVVAAAQLIVHFVIHVAADTPVSKSSTSTTDTNTDTSGNGAGSGCDPALGCH